MRHPLHRFTNFVTDRPLFDAVRRATGICLTPGEVFALLDSEDREQLLQAMSNYSGNDDAKSYVDEAMAPLLARRTCKGSDLEPDPVPRNDAAGARQDVHPRTREWVVGDEAVLIVEAVMAERGDPTLAFYTQPLHNGAADPGTKAASIELGRDELPELAGVLLGLATTATFSRGTAKRFALTIDRSGTYASISIVRNARRIVFPLPPFRAYHVSTLAIRQLARASALTPAATVVHLRATIPRLAQLSVPPGDSATKGSSR